MHVGLVGLQNLLLRVDLYDSLRLGNIQLSVSALDVVYRDADVLLPLALPSVP